mgnify:CR=1 FL=1
MQFDIRAPIPIFKYPSVCPLVYFNDAKGAPLDKRQLILFPF